MAVRFTNRLAAEKSPYLRQHAHNPVDWMPWGEEAFARARTEQKPIFLSIGYSTCHWCHVMAHESFENEAIAQILNRDFVPVKVDREERPDVDRVYMAYVQAATGQGGWPMSVWLTPDLKPFYGGTYFPPDARWGRPGLAAILEALARAWKDEHGKLLAEGDRVLEALQAVAHGVDSDEEMAAAKTGAGDRKGGGPEGGKISMRKHPSGETTLAADLPAAASRAFDQCFRQLQESFDPVHGGFGAAPKFPRAAVFNFLHRVAAVQGPASEAGAAAMQMTTVTLRKMAEGGIHDHVGGGFHRYSVDEEWFVPHFEKMLYDQAQLALCFLEARQACGDERYAWVARDIVDYVLRDLTGPQGGFCSAEDADSLPPVEDPRERRGANDADFGRKPAEGAFYVWTKDELVRVLGGDAEFFCTHYGAEPAGNVPASRDPHGELQGKNILRQRQPLADTARQFGGDLEAAGDRLQACLGRLREVRARRPRPSRDDKILAAWNGLMISALARGSRVLGDPGYGERAAQTAEFLRREMYDEATGTLYRSYREGRGNHPGFAEDYAYLVQGLLDLYETSFEIRWLQWAEQLQITMDELFWDDVRGGYFNSPANDPTIIVRLKEDYDGAEPAPGSVAVMNLLRLDWMLGEDRGTEGRRPEAGHPAGGPMPHRDRALNGIAALRFRWENAPHALPQLLCALELALQPPRTVVLAGDPRADDFRRLTAVLHERSGPWRVLLACNADSEWLVARRPHLAEMTPVGGHATAYVCENLACQPPVTEPEDLRRLLAQAAGSSAGYFSSATLS